ncbi:unnamed protein product [Orchesella dallaii]|uniref:LETM1-like C-terminal domain-containing protein n=1 Tax=Orchesella dallaii TaxID=48710 RepID=A0ABP1S8M7_9HEXA
MILDKLPQLDREDLVEKWLLASPFPTTWVYNNPNHEEREEVRLAEPEFVGPTPVESRSDVAPFATHLAPNAYVPPDDDHTVVSVVNTVLMRKGPPLPSADDMITADDFDALEVVIEKLGKQKLIIEKEELQDLREEMSDYKEDVEQLAEVADRAEDLNTQVRESKGARRLFNKLNNMVSKLEKRVSTVEETKT